METSKKNEFINPLNPDKKKSYDELDMMCFQLYKQLREADVSAALQRLDCLFSVLKYESVIKDPEFVGKCVDEIKDIITLPEAETEKPEKE